MEIDINIFKSVYMYLFRVTMDLTRKELEVLLETHFCDLDDTREHESRLKKLSDKYFQDKNIPRYVKIFNSLSEEKRLKILSLLTIREMCNCELTVATNSSQPNLTYHIKILENAGLVRQRREGKFIYYSLKDDPVTNLILDLLRELFKTD